MRCYSPAGEVLATVRVPAPNTSSVAFIGAELDTLLITTARGAHGCQLGGVPDCGRLFTADVGVSGHPVTPWQNRPTGGGVGVVHEPAGTPTTSTHLTRQHLTSNNT